MNGFQAHMGTFAQVLNIRRSHWIFVSNIGCESNVVHVYDTFYTSLPSSTVNTIARLAFCSSDVLTIKMVDVDLQKNSSDCGVLSIAIAFDILSARAPCVASYDPELIRQHLCECLNNCCLSPFPALSQRSLTDIKYKFETNLELYCVCRMPELPGDKWVECEACSQWFHRKCIDIPNAVFDRRIKQPWECPQCQEKP